MRDLDLTTLTDSEFLALRRAVLEEKARRDAAPQVEAALAEAAAAYHEANPPETTDDGTPIWRQPVGAFDAWPVGAVVAHGGRRWRNLLSKVNVWEPGNDGPVPTWEDITPAERTPDPDPTDPPADPSPPPTPEWSPGTTYAVDDEVTYQGTTYRVVQAHTAQPGWEPPNVPALWARD